MVTSSPPPVAARGGGRRRAGGRAARATGRPRPNPGADVTGALAPVEELEGEVHVVGLQLGALARHRDPHPVGVDVGVERERRRAVADARCRAPARASCRPPVAASSTTASWSPVRASSAPLVDGVPGGLGAGDEVDRLRVADGQGGGDVGGEQEVVEQRLHPAGAAEDRRRQLAQLVVGGRGPAPRSGRAAS